MSAFYYNLRKGNRCQGARIVAVDTEWAKNWRAPEPFVPFCSSIHSIFTDGITDKIDLDRLCMETELYFRADDQTNEEYAKAINDMLRRYGDCDTTLVGHQLSSDLHTLKYCSPAKVDTVEFIIDQFKRRKGIRGPDSMKVADTRYDIKDRVSKKGGEKLRNVSLRMRIFAVQTELDEMSLTKMYNLYVADKDVLKREMLQVLNWRHAFQTALVWLVNSFPGRRLYNSRFDSDFLLTNDIMYEMGKTCFSYLNSKEFLATRSDAGISCYVRQNAPRIRVFHGRLSVLAGR
jgi:hypothetical protein